MIYAERTDDHRLIEGIVKHPRIWTNEVVHDAIPAREDWRVPSGMICLLVYNDEKIMGGFVFEKRSDEEYLAHMALLPAAWGPNSATCCYAAIDWMKEHTKAKRIIAKVPQFNRLCIALCKRINMRLTAVHKAMYRKNGEPVNAEQYEVLL